MSDLLFRCPACGKHLVIDEAGAGTGVSCTDCRTRITVPAPALAFACPACRHALRAAAADGGVVFQCPACEADAPVPIVVGPSGRPPSTTEKAGARKPCPHCGAQSVARDGKCKACGHAFGLPQRPWAASGNDQSRQKAVAKAVQYRAIHEKEDRVRQRLGNVFLAGGYAGFFAGLVLLLGAPVATVPYAAAFFASIVLGILAAIQGRVGAGLSLILLSAVIPAIMVFGLGPARIQQMAGELLNTFHIF